MKRKPKRFALADPLGWYSTCRSLLERNLSGQELSLIAEDMKLDLVTAEYVVSAARPFIKAFPRELKHGQGGVLSRSYREFIPRADQIGKGMYEMARQCLNGRFFVRNIVLQYADRPKRAEWLTLSLHNGRVPKLDPCLEDSKALVVFVSELGVADLKIGLVASLSATRATNVAAVRRKLRLSDDTPDRTQELRTNRSSGASTQLVGIEVVRRVTEHKAAVDQVFESVMAWAKVIEPWCFFAP